jgi:hypothetical protein
MPPAQATGTTNSLCQKFIKATAVDDWSEKSFCVSSDTLLVSVRLWYSKDIQPLYLVTDACAQFIQAPVRALYPLWIPCVTNLSERILFVEAMNLLELYTDSVFSVGIRSVFLGIYHTDPEGKLGRYISV